MTVRQLKIGNLYIVQLQYIVIGKNWKKKFRDIITVKLTVNEYTVENSFRFCQDVGNLSNTETRKRTSPHTPQQSSASQAG